MIVIVHGDPAKTGRMTKFECAECGCVFIAGHHETYGNLPTYGTAAYCPDCGMIVMAKRGEVPAKD